jgi:TP901 family phage tail tape measure protein
MATGGDFLAKIRLVLEGKNQAVSGLHETQKAAQQLAKTKITSIFDKDNALTGKKIEETFSKITDTTKKASPLMEQFGMAMRRALIVAPVWMILRGAMMAVSNTISSQVKFLIDLETAMTRIKIVGKGTETEYKNLQNALIGLAYTYGTTASEAADAALIFAQQGRTIKETVELTRAAMLASKILGTDIKTAVDDMTAAIEGFKLGIGDATTIVDKWINVEKQFAVTSKDLADATKVAGASANQLGITMSEFLGDVTAAVEVTRKTGSEVARGLSFIYARLLTSGKSTVEQIAKIPFYLDATGKSTNVVGTEMRSVSSILGDLAGKWETLSVKEKLEIATALGSKRQMVILNALMQNYTASLDARIAALTSAGSAEKAFALIQDTTAIKLQRVGAAWNVLTTAIGDTSAFKASLSLFDKMIINFTALIDYEKAYGALYAREINKVQLGNETRLNEIKSLEELIAVRSKLAKAPQTAENIGRLKIIQEAIDSISKKEPRIRVALETGKPEELRKAIEERIKELSIEKIRLNVSLEFEPKIAGIERKIAELKTELQFTGGTEAVKIRTELAGKEKELKQLYEDQKNSIEEQYKVQKGQAEASKIMVEGIEDEESASIELTESEKERLNIEKELIKIRYNGVDSLEAQVKKEMELISNSKTLYDAHTKNLKLEELSNKLLDTKLQKRQKEINSLVDLTMKYEQADMIDKQRIKRLAELQQMKPEEVASNFSYNMFDKGIIEEYWSSFSEEAQLAVAKTTDLFKEMIIKLPEITSPTAITPGNVAKEAQAQKNITNTVVGAQIQELNINMPDINYETLADKAGQKVADRLKSDGEFQNLVAKVIRDKI